MSPHAGIVGGGGCRMWGIVGKLGSLEHSPSAGCCASVGHGIGSRAGRRRPRRRSVRSVCVDLLEEYRGALFFFDPGAPLAASRVLEPIVEAEPHNAAVRQLLARA